MALTRISLGVVAVLILLFAIFLPSVHPQNLAPAPAPTSDGYFSLSLSLSLSLHIYIYIYMCVCKYSADLICNGLVNCNVNLSFLRF